MTMIMNFHHGDPMATIVPWKWSTRPRSKVLLLKYSQRLNLVIQIISQMVHPLKSQSLIPQLIGTNTPFYKSRITNLMIEDYLLKHGKIIIKRSPLMLIGMETVTQKSIVDTSKMNKDLRIVFKLQKPEDYDDPVEKYIKE